MTPLQKTAQAVIDRWNSPSWKDQPHTAEYIEELRKALDAELQQALNALQELWLLGDRAAAIANPAIEALKIASQQQAKPLENSEIDSIGLLGVEQFPSLFNKVPWGNELMPYARHFARAIEAHHGITPADKPTVDEPEDLYALALKADNWVQP